MFQSTGNLRSEMNVLKKTEVQLPQAGIQVFSIFGLVLLVL